MSRMRRNKVSSHCRRLTVSYQAEVLVFGIWEHFRQCQKKSLRLKECNFQNSPLFSVFLSDIHVENWFVDQPLEIRRIKSKWRSENIETHFCSESGAPTAFLYRGAGRAASRAQKLADRAVAWLDGLCGLMYSLMDESETVACNLNLISESQKGLQNTATNKKSIC